MDGTEHKCQFCQHYLDSTKTTVLARTSLVGSFPIIYYSCTYYLPGVV
jgi:hypothetical protein